MQAWGLVSRRLDLGRETAATPISPLFTTTHTSIYLASHLHIQVPPPLTMMAFKTTLCLTTP
jgi:hypothetical protein